MRHLTRTPSRFLLLLVLAAILLISGISFAASRRSSTAEPVDCAGDCADQRNKLLERCNALSDTAAANCRERAGKMYDKCVERCNNEKSPGER